MDLPHRTLRLFSHYRPEDLSAESSTCFLIIRLFEDGDTRDLSWLIGCFPEEHLTECFLERGRRQLSRRSASFWSAVLDRPLDTERTFAEALWTV
jgi:hypothetical protein